MEDILVVDDEWDIAEAMIYFLQTEGYGAQYASNGEVALQLLVMRPPALVMTDFMMPVMSGCELLRTILDREDLANTPVIMMSSLPEDVVRDRCPAMKTFLSKPFKAESLLKSVRDTLGESPSLPA